ncbi:MarR family transcriptional regulator [Paenarthrobacter nitroguajacolicus]|uniref:MarR family transcriptional regulator n=1 Tax=Paenarthrobacter nitroguajacolicus TaxID=211146 RepID=UPI003D7C1DDD
MGSRAQADVLRQLAILGPSTIGQLQSVVDVSRPSLNRLLDALGAAGLVLTDPPEGARQGRDVVYEVRRTRIRDLSRAYVDYIEGR